MKINLIGQPYADSGSLHRYLIEGCADERFTHLSFAAAWAKRSGLRRVETALQGFAARGGLITSVVGISEGGATRQGLSATLDLPGESYVFHDSGRTFHPKIYLFTGPDHWSALVGSSNLTAGGLYWNYEASLAVSGDRADADSRTVVSDLEGWFGKLIRDTEVCLPLTKKLIEQLVLDPECRIGNEDRINARGARPAAGPAYLEGPLLFGRSKNAKHPDPAKRPRRADAPLSSDLSPEPAYLEGDDTTLEDVPLGESEIITHAWHKKMTASDAQQPKGEKSNPTGHIKLSQAKHALDHKTYFRNHFFSDLEWKKVQKGSKVHEQASVSFQVIVGAKNHGVHALFLDHAPHRVSNQNNVPTWLHWGDYLGKYLRDKDHVGEYVTIERFEDGSRQLTIATDPIG
ncbi:hypothetical protein ACWFQ8_26950 [Streptomyces sp. NPDC055254]